MKIVIAGAGAMGSRFGLMLHEAGNQVILIDSWPEHVESINKDGLRAVHNGVEKVIPISAFLPDQVDPDYQADLIILFTKSLGLEVMLKSISGILSSTTNVLCLLNGLGHEEIIKRYVPEENIFVGSTIWTADLLGPGYVHLNGDGGVIFKNWMPGYENIAKGIVEILDKAGLGAQYSENIMQSIYSKVALNATLNPLCTLLECVPADLGKSPLANEMLRNIISEISAVAAAEGVQIDVTESVNFIESKANDRENIGQHYPSMHQDLIQNNRRTEIDSINGAIASKGRKYGIPTPYCDLITQLIHTKEFLRSAK